MRPPFILVTLLAFPALLACGGSTPAAEGADASAAKSAPENFTEQVARGEKVYGAKCSGCHGDAGEGRPGAGPAVVGLDKGALPLDPPPGSKGRTTQFKTVADLANYVATTMPPNAPGSLSTDDYFSVVAFDLKANGIDLADKKLDAELAKTLEIPRK
jgi:S-disulfanyl-L-cysteine oxidoreductase SoxD